MAGATTGDHLRRCLPFHVVDININTPHAAESGREIVGEGIRGFLTLQAQGGTCGDPAMSAPLLDPAPWRAGGRSILLKLGWKTVVPGSPLRTRILGGAKRDVLAKVRPPSRNNKERCSEGRAP
ncbi:hypothetical protein E2562_007935 [Oryza meyeriana var. granulata]|uniref:Uncharacterized protein n=1 Tax=Oryza meyeriana var. granulata TaxID=110450 RepID=A0A6G1DF71_9ORYZ|nr:hypothetical protein E2562_007935 [Oryza meyeriana var. granulata]